MRHKAFSRWELLALGAVASVCSGLLLPVLAQVADKEREQRNQRDVRCGDNLKRIALAFRQYNHDYARMPPAALHSQQGEKTFYGWADVTQHYAGNLQIYRCPADKHPNQSNPVKPAYTDYWFNTNAAGLGMGAIRSPASLIIVGDGDGDASNSTARYNLNTVPRSWIQTPHSPVYRHNGKGIYAFADGHVKKAHWEVLLPNRPTLENK